LPGTEVHRFENPSQTAAIRRKIPEAAGFFTNGEFGPAQGVDAFHEHSLCAMFFYPVETPIEEDPES